MSKKVYISGPITGHVGFQLAFTTAEEALKAKGYTVFNPAIWDKEKLELSYEDYITLDLAMLSICDVVTLLPGYRNSKGCSIEVEFAKSRNIRIVEFEEFINE